MFKNTKLALGSLTFMKQLKEALPSKHWNWSIQLRSQREDKRKLFSSGFSECLGNFAS